MTSTRLWLSALIIALVVLVAFMLSVPHASDVGVKPTAPTVASTPAVTVHDVYKKGLHTISGSVEAPNACALVSATATLIGNASSTQSILVAVTLQTDSGICLQVPTNANFQTTLAAPAKLPITATVNGSPASTTPS
ncbi:hypothetical protein HKL94_02595 [Candidatus Parcubacteria bacterium]|nr:hypothetical protein [Candidatus Parcubacteria bacterium]